MKVHLDRVGDEPVRWQETRRIELSILERPEVVHLSEIDWKGEITDVGSGHLLQGRLDYEQTLRCQRCLKDTSERIETRVDLLLVSEGEEPTEGEIELEEKDLDVLYVSEGNLNTEPILVEQLQLNVPMRPLCQDMCEGLCPECGVDLNLETCDCQEQTIDPRWSVLRDLRELKE